MALKRSTVSPYESESVGRSSVCGDIYSVNLQDCIKKLILAGPVPRQGGHVGARVSDRWGREGSTNDA